jgi:iron(III) transport system substrate-binding protein
MQVKNRIVRCVGFVICVTALSLTCLSCRKSPSEGLEEVVLYCSVDQQLGEPIIAEFERQTGIKVLARYDTEASKTVGLVQKIIAEAASPIADVFWSGEVSHTIRLARKSLLAKYTSDRTVNWPATFADSQGRWYGFALRARVIAYNTRAVSKTDAPKSLEDVLEPKWKGRIVMAAPEFGTTGSDVASWFAHYGNDRAREILQSLKANRIRLVSGNSTAVRMVATGQADICFTDTDDVYAGQRNDWPIAMNYLDQAGNGTLAIPNTAAMIKNAPHQENAARLMDFLLSEKLEQMLAESYSRNSPIHPELAQQFEECVIPKALSIDYNAIADQMQNAITTAGEILR